MKHRSQRRKLFLSFTVVIIAFTIAYLLLIFGRDYQNSKERYLNDRAQLVGQVASQAENYFSLMDNILLQIIYSDAIYEALTAANHDLSPTNYFDINLQAKKNCTQDMSAYISITNQISRASIFGVRGGLLLHRFPQAQSEYLRYLRIRRCKKRGATEWFPVHSGSFRRSAFLVQR